MQVLTLLLALVAPITASAKHDGRKHLHPMPRRQVQGLSALTTPSPQPTTAANPIPSFSISPTISSYVFPITVIQAPIATVCPDTPTSSALFSILPVSSMLSIAKQRDGKQRASSNSTKWVQVQVNATALLPNGSTVVFLSASSTTAVLLPTISTSPTPTSAGPDTARIIMDNNGCQTIFSARTTTWCSTTIQPVGMLPVSITDCDQWVTFSSQRLDAGTTALTTTAAIFTPLSAFSAPDGPVEYYLAHWYDLIRAGIPNHVRVQECLPESVATASGEPDCVTSSESWDVVTSTITRTGISLASFAGPVVLTIGPVTVTTTLSFESTATTTSVITSSAIERHRLEEESTSSTQTVTVLVTMPTTKTLELDSLTETTVTVHRTTTVTVHRTSTVEVTETRTRSIGVSLPTVVAAVDTRQ